MTRFTGFRFILALLALVAAAVVAAQPLSGATRSVQFSNLSTEDGLSSEFINDLAQDGRGYMWFATQAGLNRFDGHDIRVYEHHRDQADSLSHGFIRTLYVDDTGRLWIGTDRGINTYDAASDSFNREPLDAATSRAHARAILQDAHNRMWIGTIDAGLIGVAPDGSGVVTYRHEPGRDGSLPDDHVIDLHIDDRGRLWVGTEGGGLARFDAATGSFVRYQHDADDETSLSDDHIRSIFQDSSGDLWVGTAEGGVNRMRAGTDSFTRYRHNPDDPNSLGAGQVASILEDAAGTIWVGTEAGLFEWRPAIDGFVGYRRNPADPSSLLNDQVMGMFQDASGVLWIATRGGASAWNYVSDTFQPYRTDSGFLMSDVVTAVSESDDGNVWVGTYGGGLSRLDIASGSAHHFRHDPSDPASICDDRVTAVHVDGHGTVWAGTRAGGLCRLEEDGTFTHFRSNPSDPDSLSGNAVTRIHSDTDGTLWVGVFGGGLNRMDLRNEQPVFVRFNHDPDDPQSLSSDRVLTIHSDSGGDLWIGTENAGLNKLDRSSGKFSRFDIEPFEDAAGLESVNGTPWEIYEAADGTFWIGTMGQGLLRWTLADRNAGNLRFEQFGPADGLVKDVYGIVAGAGGELWLSSSRGLFRFDPVLRSVRRFDRTNGLRNNEFNVGVRYRSRNGQVMFGGTDGLLVFDPYALKSNDRPPRIDVSASSRVALLARSNPQSAPQVELGYLDPFVDFRFVALDYTSPDKNQYRYRLTGFESDWNDSNDFRRAVYSNLPAGDYVFTVQASNSDGVWNTEGASIRVTVIPPPWRSSWAYLLYALTFIALVGVYVFTQRRQHKREAQQRARLESLVEARTGELRSRNEDLQTLNGKLQEASVTDQLTGLRNRRYVDQFIEEQIATVQRRIIDANKADENGKQRDTSRLLFVLMIDLDGFKPINDSFGHPAGDAALLEVKNRLLEACRRSDVVVRWGGDEFLIFGQAATFVGAQVLAEKVREYIATEPYHVGLGRRARLSASIGVAAIPFVEGRKDLGTWIQIVTVADQAAYVAKRNGRNGWVSMRGTSLMNEADFFRIKDELRELVDAGKLRVDSSISDLRLEARPATDPSGAAGRTAVI